MRANRIGTRSAIAAAALVSAASIGLVAQNERPSPKVVVTDYDMQRAATPPPLAPDELAGKALFVQRCALCHDLLGQPATSTPGPWVDAETVKTRGEAAVRQKINMGSRTMPGWRHTLSGAQVDQVIAYLKTVTPDQRPKPPGQVVIPID
jgi:mono/diheme cytochrome c family protein